jgi:hypothetical protein
MPFKILLESVKCDWEESPISIISPLCFQLKRGNMANTLAHRPNKKISGGS